MKQNPFEQHCTKFSRILAHPNCSCFSILSHQLGRSLFMFLYPLSPARESLFMFLYPLSPARESLFMFLYLLSPAMRSLFMFLYPLSPAVIGRSLFMFLYPFSLARGGGGHWSCFYPLSPVRPLFSAIPPPILRVTIPLPISACLGSNTSV